MADKNHAGYPSNSVTLVTNQIIKMLCFDATEPSNGNSDRRGYGNNRYIYSNLRQWLNSPAAAGQWYTAQHSADQTPDSSHVWNGVNPYSGLAGFLNAFTANERAALLNTTITVGKSSTDGGGTETCTDKIFPLSCTEVGLSGDHVCGSKLAIFSDNNSRIATVTASCRQFQLFQQPGLWCRVVLLAAGRLCRLGRPRPQRRHRWHSARERRLPRHHRPAPRL